MTTRRPPSEDAPEALGHTFSDARLLARALTHVSREGSESYERLEFLGDAVLGHVASAALFKMDLAATEGVLSSRKAWVVSARSIAAAARRAGLVKRVRVGRSLRGGEHLPQSVVADVFEAVLGAIYLDGGFAAARDAAMQALAPELEEATKRSTRVDYKTALQEWSQARYKIVPEYREVARSGPDHAPTFRVEAWVQGARVGVGTAGTRKAAEMSAAQAALAAFERDEEPPTS